MRFIERLFNDIIAAIIDDCNAQLDSDFIFEQDGAPAHTSRQAQEFLMVNAPDFIGKDEWPPNSPDLNPLDYCVWGLMLESYKKISPKPTSLTELKVALQSIWDELPLTTIQKSIRSFRKRLQLCVRVKGGHFEHLLNK